MTQRYIKAFRREYERNRLANNGLLNEFVETYKNIDSEIPNLNSGSKWDKLNMVNIEKVTNPMAYHRICLVHDTITNNGTNNRLLDIGFGQGFLEEKLKKSHKCGELWGIDISKKSVADKQKKYPEWKFFVGDITKIDLPQGYFNYVVILEVLEHINSGDVLSVLTKIHKSLTLGGHIIVSVPLNEGLEEMISNGLNPNAHVRIYSPSIIKFELIATGYELEKSIDLYAFHSTYWVKSLFAKYFKKKPNNIVIVARKI